MPVDLDDDFESNHDYTDIDTKTVGSPNRKRNILIFVIALIVVLAVLAIILGVTLGTRSKKSGGNDPTPPYPPHVTLAQSMNIDQLMGNLQQLNLIAIEHQGSRAVELGYNASAQWVYDVISKETDFDVSFQYFSLFEYNENQPPMLSSTVGNDTTSYGAADFRNMGEFNGNLNLERPLSLAQNVGCMPTDFGPEVQGTIVLVHRGDCTFSEKVTNAHNAGADAILIYNRGTGGDNGPFSGGFSGLNPIPTFSLSFSVGDDLRTLVTNEVEVTINLFVDMTQIETVTMNVIADTKEGDPNHVVVTGSHLDSVPAGPGINDNGSGSSANIEMAKALYRLKENKNITINNKVRFAWWAAEEVGLLGSTHYVNNLVQNDPEELQRIALNLNYDMLGSPNYYLAIYNGTGAAEDIRTASENIQRYFESFFIGVEQHFDLTPFDGRSDYGPFIANGIPAGGLFSGAEKIKTIQQRADYGGLANAAYDPCYHQFCDDIGNIDTESLKVMAEAAATLVQLFCEGDIEQLLGADQSSKRGLPTPTNFAFKGPLNLY